MGTTTPIEFSNEQKLQCVERELRFRRVVYDNRLKRNAMTQEQADHEIGCMEAIARDYREAIKAGGGSHG